MHIDTDFVNENQDAMRIIRRMKDKIVEIAQRVCLISLSHAAAWRFFKLRLPSKLECLLLGPMIALATTQVDKVLGRMQSCITWLKTDLAL